MKSHYLAAAVLLVLGAGCGKEPLATGSAATADTASLPATAAAAAACPAVVTGYNPMPEGVAVELSYHLRGDRIYADARGNYRRRATFEYLDGDANTTFDALAASLAGAGFVAKEKREKDGRINIGFNKKGLGALLLSVNPNSVPKPAHPDAKGIFVLDYPYAGTIAETSGTPAAL